MSYFFATSDDQRRMLAAIGVDSVEDLFAGIPDEVRLKRTLDIPAALSELELTQHLRELADRNLHVGKVACFLGAGSYDHFIPAVVDQIAARSEFYTSYTPYQPEVSQGNLQVMFEYQSLICRLTGMEVSNASLYDGASALAEAALMAISITRRYGKVIAPANLHPHYREVLSTYLANLEPELVTLPTPNGVIDLEALEDAMDGETACVILQQPNFFGALEDVAAVAQRVHAKGALLVLLADPISLGILKRPGDLGADIVVAEGQSLGIPMGYGGPYLGILACREAAVRRMPGRIVGQTVDRRGRRCFVLTLQTREQHIRREKATSNICTNQGLMALRATIYLAIMGSAGLRKAAELSLRKAHYAAQRLASIPRFSLALDVPFFKEFVIRDHCGQVDDVLAAARREGILAGVPLARWYPEMDDCFLVAVTEQRSRAEIDRLADILAQLPSPQTATHA